MASKVDMSLEDIIKTSKIGRSRGRGRARGGRGQGFTRGRGGSRLRGSTRGRGRGGTTERILRQVTSGRVGKPRRGNFSQSPQPARWLHDRFEGSAGGRRGGQESRGRGLVKLVVSNLDYGVNDQDLKELFGEFGGFVKAYVHYDISGRSNGTAFILYSSLNAAEQARKQYNGVQLDGRPMDIQLMATNSTNIAGRTTGSPRFESARGGRGSFRGGARGARIGRGGGRGRGRGRGRGGRMPTKEELDNQLDSYNSQTD